MRQLSRFEVVCLVAITSMLALMVYFFSGSKYRQVGTGAIPEEALERGALQSDGPSGTDPGSGSEPGSGSPGYSGEDSLAESNEADFTKQAQLIPEPLPKGDEHSSTNVPGVKRPTVKPAASPRLFGDNEVMVALQQVEAMPWGDAAEELLLKTVSKWGARDPIAALQYSQQIESRRVRSALLSGIFNSWAKTDVNAAYNWLNANQESDPGTFKIGLKPVFVALSAGGIDQAMKMALALSSGSDRMAAVRTVVDQAGNGGMQPSSMIAYLDSLQTVGEKQSYASMLAKKWAGIAPTEAAQWALSLNDPVLKKATLTSTVGTWANDNPQAAADWVLSLPEGDLRTRQIAQVTQAWAYDNPVKAADWLLSQRPPSPTLDPAIQSFVGTVMKSNPEGAAKWATTISDPKLRNTMIVSASREWMKHDPQQAYAYIMSAPITPEQRAKLLQKR